MKEVEKQDKAPSEQVEEVKSEKRYKGTYRLHVGHSIWELHYESNEIRLADVKRHFDTNKKETRTELIEKDGCLYMMALNKKNARKKFDKAIEVAKEKLRKKPWAATNETHTKQTMNKDENKNQEAAQNAEATENAIADKKQEETCDNTNEACCDEKKEEVDENAAEGESTEEAKSEETEK